MTRNCRSLGLLTLLFGGALVFAGCEGDAGPKGDPGENGTAGEKGADGKDGVKGADGAKGADGVIKGTLSGTVTNKADNSALKDVEVTLSPAPAGVALKTDAAGKFTGEVPLGVYKLTFKLADYKEATADANVFPGETATVDIKLEPSSPVMVSVAVTGTVEPGQNVTLKTTVTAYDGSTPTGYAWTQKGGVTATAAGGQNTDTETYALGSAADYKAALLSHMRLLDRLMVLGINPFSIEEAEKTSFEVTVTTSTGTYKTTVDLMPKIAFATVTTGLQNVPIGLPVMVHGKDGVTWAWSITTKPASSSATLSDGSSQNPYFTPDVVGMYTLEQTAGGATINVYAGEWVGAISGRNATDGLADSADCTACHNDNLAPNNFADWRKTGHAHIFSTQLDTSTHYGEGCFGCHTVGYNPDVDNKGFDEASDYAAFLAAGIVNTPGDNWIKVVNAHPATAKLANIQCENCHGPNSQDTNSGGLHMDVGMTTGRSSFSSDVCGACHGEPKRHARFQQWEESGHGNYEVATAEGASGSCAACHSAQGFVLYLENLKAGNTSTSVTVTWTADEAQPQSCATCHDPHAIGDTSGEPNTATVRLSGSTPMLPGGYMATGVGRGAICFACHNSRRGVYNDASFDGIVKKIDDRAPHRGAQGDVLMGQNGFFLANGARSPHSFITDSCANCHMERTDPPPELSYNLGGTNHTFAASTKICADCHAATLVDPAQLQSAFDAASEALRLALEKAIIDEITFHTAQGRTVDVTGTTDEAGTAPLTITITDGANVSAVELVESHGRQAMNLTHSGTVVHHARLAAGTLIKSGGVDSGDLIRNAFGGNRGQVIGKAGWNYYLSHADGSRGIHNPGFLFGMLQQAQNALVNPTFAAPDP